MRDYAFPDYAELEDVIAKVQTVKKAFLHKFWKLSGRQVVQEAARWRLEEVCFSFYILPSLGEQDVLAKPRRMLWRKVRVLTTSREGPWLAEAPGL